MLLSCVMCSVKTAKHNIMQTVSSESTGTVAVGEIPVGLSLMVAPNIGG